MPLLLLLLIIALAVYVIVAFHPRRLGLSADMTAIGLALLCFTVLIAAGAL
jgi:hypothetical protein